MGQPRLVKEEMKLFHKITTTITMNYKNVHLIQISFTILKLKFIMFFLSAFVLKNYTEQNKIYYLLFEKFST